VGEILQVNLPKPRNRVTLADDPAYLAARKSVIDFLYQRHTRPQAA
jgi:nitrate/nitrite transport system ATP-binding protein